MPGMVETMFSNSQSENSSSKLIRNTRTSVATIGVALAVVATPALVQAPGSATQAISHWSGGGKTVSGKNWLGGKGVAVIRSRQCTELASRLYGTRKWGTITNFYGMKTNRKVGTLTYKRNGSYTPVPGDVLVEKGGSSYNHVAVVDRVRGNKIYTMEQNAAPNGRHIYRWNKKSKTAAGAYRNRHVGGFIHSSKNPNR